MRVLRIRLRNFRGVVDRAVAFRETGVTVVQGANEVGKTSLVDGLDLLLDKPDSSRDQRVLAVQPVDGAGGPEVEAEIVAGEYRFTYRKRWLKGPETALTVTAPRRETLTGREAHDRACAIIASTVDQALWRALRVQQAEPVAQAALSDNTALTRALDLAAGSPGDGVAEHHDLYARVQQEYLTFFTAKTEKETGDYRRAMQQAREAAEDRDRYRAALEQVRGYAEEHERLSRDLARLREQKETRARRLAELTERWQDIEARRAEIERLQQEARAADLQAELARDTWQKRQELVGQIDVQTADLAALATRRDTIRLALDRARQEAAAAEKSHRRLRDTLRDAEERHRLASDDLAHLHDLAELDRLAQRRARCQDAVEQIAAAEEELAGIRLDQPGLARLEDAHQRLVRARAELDAASGTVRLTALTTLTAQVNGTAHDLGEDQCVTEQIAESVDLLIPGVARIQILPGSGERDLRQAHEEARDSYRELCDQARVADLNDARAQLQRRAGAEHRRQIHREALDRELAGLSLDQLHTDHARLAVTTREYRAGRPARDPLPAGVDAAQTALAQARQRVDHLRTQLDLAEEAMDRTATLVTQLATDHRVIEQQISDLEQRLAASRERLDTERRKESDDDLRSTADRRSTAAESAVARWQSAADALAAEDPDSVRLLLDNETDVVHRLDAEIHRIDADMLKLTALLDTGRGTQDAYDDACARATAAEQHLAGIERRAHAARLLHQTLTRHRDAAQRAYVTPFRNQLVRFGRIVFGHDFDVEVDDTLTITHRTLDGVTVPFAHLSGGAKEQLCLCARLACATLVDPDDGVPVVIDDALGYTDPDRLARLGAVFNASANHAQIIVLTCAPDRYLGIGNADIVHLRPSTPPPPERTEFHDDTDSDGDGDQHRADIASRHHPERVPGSAVEAILALLRSTGQALGRAEIVDRTGIDPDTWPAAIRELKETGQVTQTGDRRGARYSTT